MAQQKIEVIKELYSAAQTESTQRLAELEEAVAEYVEYQRELAAATEWIVKTKESIQVGDNTLSLQDMLTAQEVQGFFCFELCFFEDVICIWVDCV